MLLPAFCFMLNPTHMCQPVQLVGGFTLSGRLDYQVQETVSDYSSSRGHRCRPLPPRYVPSFSWSRGFIILTARRFASNFATPGSCALGDGTGLRFFFLCIPKYTSRDSNPGSTARKDDSLDTLLILHTADPDVVKLATHEYVHEIP